MLRILGVFLLPFALLIPACGLNGGSNVFGNSYRTEASGLVARTFDDQGGTLSAAQSLSEDESFKKVGVEVPSGAFPSPNVVSLAPYGSLSTDLMRHQLGMESLVAEGPSVYLYVSAPPEVALSLQMATYGGEINSVIRAQSTSSLRHAVLVVTEATGKLEFELLPASSMRDPKVAVRVGGVYQPVQVDRNANLPKKSSFTITQVGMGLAQQLSAYFGVPAKNKPVHYCQDFAKSRPVGMLEGTQVNESSGMAASTQFADRIYHVNDSGSAGEFFFSRLTGQQTQKVRINGFVPVDVEAIDVGPCGDETCVFIGDIGDNLWARNELQLVTVLEKEDFGSSVPLHSVTRLVYPGNARYDAETLMVSPKGNVYIVTKALTYGKPSPKPTVVFKLNAEDLGSSNPVELTEVGRIDLLRMVSPGYHLGTLAQLRANFDPAKLATARPGTPEFEAIKPLFSKTITDGKMTAHTVMLLSYGAVYLFELNLDEISEYSDDEKTFPNAWVPGDYTTVEIQMLPQQEAITFLPGTRNFVYTTEIIAQLRNPAPILFQECLR